MNEALVAAEAAGVHRDLTSVTRIVSTGATLSAEQKRAFVVEFVRLAKTQECGYPPVGGGSVTGHTSEAMIMRDMLSAGVAIYDEEPEMYRLAAGRRRSLPPHRPVVRRRPSSGVARRAGG